ncbi:Virus attachment protein p12 family, partial [Dysosmobacter welbionis]
HSRSRSVNFLKIKRPVSNVGVFIRVPFTVSPPPKIARVFSAAIRWIFPIIQSRTG